MKKKELVISVIIALILSFIMMFITQVKSSNNVITDKSSKNSISKTKNSQESNIDNKVKVSENKLQIETSTEKSDDTSKQNSEIAVYISGEVKKPQVVKMKTGDRLVDAVEKCGGMTKDADLNAINLALLLKDEAHYIIPKIGDTSIVSQQNYVNQSSTNDKSINSISSVDTSNSSKSTININTADKTALMSLPSIGEKTAQKIIDYRENNRKFQTKEELKNVTGIGDKKYSQLEEFITVE
jgi:probable competence protein